jgi:hypothetical protein
MLVSRVRIKDINKVRDASLRIFNVPIPPVMSIGIFVYEKSKVYAMRYQHEQADISPVWGIAPYFMAVTHWWGVFGFDNIVEEVVDIVESQVFMSSLSV